MIIDLRQYNHYKSSCNCLSTYLPHPANYVCTHTVTCTQYLHLLCNLLPLIVEVPLPFAVTSIHNLFTATPIPVMLQLDCQLVLDIIGSMLIIYLYEMLYGYVPLWSVFLILYFYSRRTPRSLHKRHWNLNFKQRCYRNLYMKPSYNMKTSDLPCVTITGLPSVSG